MLRAATMQPLGHHLMHRALREVLGEPRAAEGLAGQRRAHPIRLRANAPVSDEEIRRVEAIVNAEILANAATEAQLMDIESACRPAR